MFLPEFLRVVPRISTSVHPRISVGVFHGVSANVPPGISFREVRYASRVPPWITSRDYSQIFWQNVPVFLKIFSKFPLKFLTAFLQDFLTRNFTDDRSSRRIPRKKTSKTSGVTIKEIQMKHLESRDNSPGKISQKISGKPLPEILVTTTRKILEISDE